MTGASLFFRNRLLPSIKKRKRTYFKNCNIYGNPYIDVDEGIEEEVRIFNDILGLKTYSSCEGHLINEIYSAFVVSYINDREQLKKISRAIKKENILSMKPYQNRIEERDIPEKIRYKPEKIIYFKKYSNSYLILRMIARKITGYVGSFTVKVIPRNMKIEQCEWDRIRRQRFIDVINMLYNVGLGKKKTLIR